MISVIIPVYRNEESLPELVGQLEETLSKIGREYEVILVVDGSPDNSFACLATLVQSRPRFKVVNLSRNFGQHLALCAGFQCARGDQIVLMDADLQDRPSDIPKLLEGLDRGHDIVLAVCSNPPMSLGRRLCSWLFHRTFARIAGREVPRDVRTFRAFNRKVLDALNRHPERRPVYGPLMFSIGYDFATVELPRDARRHGPSSYSLGKLFALALDCLVTYTLLPTRLVTFMGIGVAVLSLIYALVVVVQWLSLGGQLFPGLSLIVVMLAFFGGCVLFGLGIVGEYVGRVYREVLCRPRYLVKDTLNMDPPEGDQERIFRG